MLKSLLVLALTLFQVSAMASVPTYAFGINEGATTATGVEIAAKYKPFIDYLAKNLNAELTLDPVSNIKRSEERLKEGKYDIIFGKSINLLATAIRDKNYQAIAKREKPYESAFIVSKDSKIHSLKDIGNAIIYTPSPRAFTSKLAFAALKEAQIPLKPEQLKNTESQEAIPFAITNKFGEVGVVNPTVAKQWKESGGKVIFTTKPMPNWSIIASHRVSADHVEKLRELLVDMKNNPEGKAILDKLGVEALVPAKKAEYLGLLQYIGD
ncbi:MAG TPA: phosphate/phosphite/phosphonate ABC transporter substrate-binding protein [Burkholderiales bacterium]|nr:phosphate/phosphite/phosphonate ABC transporter substrate-binding protein [Burkholderiales bacterium]